MACKVILAFLLGVIVGVCGIVLAAFLDKSEDDQFDRIEQGVDELLARSERGEPNAP